MQDEMESKPTCLIVHSGAELYGSDRVVLESAIGLVQAGVQVVVLLPFRGGLVGELRRAGARVLIGPSFVLRKSLFRPRGWPKLAWGFLVGLIISLRALRTVRPQFVLVNTTTLPMWPVLSRLAGARVISHIHEADSEMPLVMRKVLASPHLAAHSIICNSEFTRDVLLEATPRLRDRTLILYNGVAGPKKRTAARTSASDQLRVLYLGRLSPRKGVDLVVRAAKDLNLSGTPVHLTVAGSAFAGMEWFEEELRASADTRRGDSAIEFTGFVDDVWPLLSAADVLVVPSRLDESFGNTAVEGILAGRPVVVSNTSGLREAARGYESAIYVEPNDAQGIADALERVYREWEYFSTHAATDAIAAEEKHSLATYRKKIADIVLNAADRP